MKNLKTILSILAGLGLIAALAGCSTGDDEYSTRPWNTPKSWENGLPSALTEGR
jgi:hypothetical protein